MKAISLLAVLFVICLSACTKSEPKVMTAQDLVKRGRTVYQTACISCHQTNPAEDGAIGPAVKGSSRELIERRVVYGDYPSDYKPKRESRVMVALPHLKNEIDALTAYLNSP